MGVALVVSFKKRRACHEAGITADKAAAHFLYRRVKRFFDLPLLATRIVDREVTRCTLTG